MEAKDLRTTSILAVSLKSSMGKTIEQEVGAAGILRITNNTGSFNYSPILLTEDILRRLGCGILEQDDSAIIYQTKKGFIFTLILDIKSVNYIIGGKYVSIKTLHDFQNLVSLTGEELTLIK